MKVCGVFGPSGVGKTPLMEGLIRELQAAGRLKSADRFEAPHA
jgi:molybdopterin-guanine dinucleotide biosynthesis protein